MSRENTLPSEGAAGGASRLESTAEPGGDRAAVAGAFWDRQAGRTEEVYWAAHTPVREYVNRWITGEASTWPIDALCRSWLPERLPRSGLLRWLRRSPGLPRHLWRGVSLGCGVGNLERCVRKAGLCRRLDAFDVSPESILEARRLAAAEAIQGINYRVADCDRLRLPRSRFHIAFFHHSLHHIADPDRLLDEIERSLHPGGFLYLDEYVGPARDEWTPATLRWAEEAYRAAPRELCARPLAPPIDPADPSEMIRASRILPAVRERFEIVVERPYWGNLLFPLLSALDGKALLAPEHQEQLASWVAREGELVAAGEIAEPLFTVVLARKR